MKTKQYAALAIIAVAAWAFLALNPQAQSGAGKSQAMKLEGAWIAQTDNGIRSLVTFAPSDPSGRSCAWRNQMVWPPALLASFGLDATTDEIGETVITGKDTAAYTAIWYGLAGGNIALICLDNASLTFDSATQFTIQHTVDVYLASADADNDGYPDPDSPIIMTITAKSISKRLGH
jgi:hypothetical protein